MLEGFELPVFAGGRRGGRPRNEASSHLRNLAWLRYLLDALDDVENWANEWRRIGKRQGARSDRSGTDRAASGKASTPIPATWRARPADADLLAIYFANPEHPPIPADPVARRPTTLDHILGPLFAGTEGGSGRYFSDRIVRGVIRPDAARLQRIDDLVPGSRRAFESEPAGMDPWFYDALDFTNPWYAKLYLWRAQDGRLEDPGWDSLISPPANGSEMPSLAPEVREQRHARHTLTDRDVNAFEALINSAMAFTACPSLAASPAGAVDEAIDRLHAAVAAASASDYSREIAEAVVGLDSPGRWAALSNGLAACRVARMLDIDLNLTTWGLRGMHHAMGGDVRALQEARYLPMPGGPGAIDSVIARWCDAGH